MAADRGLSGAQFQGRAALKSVRSQFKRLDRRQIDVLVGLPEVIMALHRQPAFGRASQRLGQAQGHLRRDAAFAAEQTGKRRRRYLQLGGNRACAKAQRLKVDVADELSGMRRGVHRLSFYHEMRRYYPKRHSESCPRSQGYSHVLTDRVRSWNR